MTKPQNLWVGSKFRCLYLVLLALFLTFSAAARQAEADSLIRLGLANFSRNPAEAAVYLQNALQLAAATGNLQAEARSRHLAGQLLLAGGNTDTVAVLFRQAEAIYHQLQDSLNLVKVKLTTGDLYLRLGIYDSALHYYTTGLAQARELQHNPLTLAALRKSGDLLWKTDHPQEAGKYLAESLRLSKYTQDTLQISRSYIALGNFFSKTKNNSLATSYLDSALVLEAYLSPRQQAAIFNTLGIISHQEYNLSAALKNYGKSLELKKLLADSAGIANTLLNIGIIYNKQQKYAAAENNYLQSLALTQTTADPYALRTIYLNLANLYRTSGKPLKSLNYRDLYDSMEAFIFTSEENRQLMDIQEKYQTLERESKINLLEKNREIDQITLQKRELQRNYLLAFLLLLATALYIIFRGYKARGRANRQLDKQNKLVRKREKEKDLLLNEVNHRVTNNLQLAGSLLRLQSDSLADQDARKVINLSRHRVETLAILHKKLYKQEAKTTISVNEYLQELTDYLIFDQFTEVQIHTNFDPLILDVEQAVPLALIYNELFTNTLKHAKHPENKLIITAGLQCRQEEVLLVLADNGVGNLSQEQLTGGQSFGTSLIRTLTRQLDGSVTCKTGNGLRTEIKFPYKKPYHD